MTNSELINLAYDLSIPQESERKDLLLASIDEPERGVYKSCPFLTALYMLTSYRRQAKSNDVGIVDSLIADSKYVGISRELLILREIKHFEDILFGIHRSGCDPYPGFIKRYLVLSRETARGWKVGAVEKRYFEAATPIEARRKAHEYAGKVVELSAEAGVNVAVDIYPETDCGINEAFAIWDNRNHYITKLPALFIEAKTYQRCNYDQGGPLVRVEVAGAFNFDILIDGYRVYKIGDSETQNIDSLIASNQRPHY